MKIRRVMGLALFVLILQRIVPALFNGAESALLAFFDLLGGTFDRLDPSSLPASPVIRVPVIAP
jgi:hypothetical protein